MEQAIGGLGILAVVIIGVFVIVVMLASFIMPLVILAMGSRLKRMEAKQAAMEESLRKIAAATTRECRILEAVHVQQPDE